MTKKISPAVAVTIALSALILLSPLAAYTNKQNEGGKIVGRIVERDTGAPLAAELSVAMRGRRGITLTHVRASEQGWFELVGLSPADIQFNTRLEGYAVERQSLSLGEGETRQLEFHLLKTVVVRGQVLDETDAPIEDAIIKVIQTPDAAIAATYQWEAGESGEIRSDARGAYSIAVHPEKAFVLEASHAKYQPVRRAMDPTAAREQAPLTLAPKRSDER